MEQPVNFACLLCLRVACATAIALAHAVGEARRRGVMEYKCPGDKCLDADRKRQHATPA